MPDPYPKSYDELLAENVTLRAAAASMQDSIGSLQATIVRQDADLAALRNPKRSPRVLDPKAKDAFQRPYPGR
jgi:hypothetical protein